MNFNHVMRELRSLRYEWSQTYLRFNTDHGVKEYSDTVQQFVTDFFTCLPYTLAHVFTISLVVVPVLVVLL